MLDNLIVSKVSKGRVFTNSEETGRILMKSRKEPIIKLGKNMTTCSYFKKSYVGERQSGEVVVRINTITCHSRFCAPCNKKRSQKIRIAMKQYIELKGIETMKFLTFTYPTKISPDGLGLSMDDMNRKFRNMRRKKVFSDAIQGWMGNFEANEDENGLMNPHKHILLQHKMVDLSENRAVRKLLASVSFLNNLDEYCSNIQRKSPYLLHNEIKENVLLKIEKFLEQGLYHQLIWSTLLGNVGLGKIVDIRELKTVHGSVEEVCKYITKPWSTTETGLITIAEQLYNRRVFSFGGAMQRMEEALELNEKDFIDEDVEEDIILKPWKPLVDSIKSAFPVYKGYGPFKSKREIKIDKLVVVYAVEKGFIDIEYQELEFMLRNNLLNEDHIDRCMKSIITF